MESELLLQTVTALLARADAMNWTVTTLIASHPNPGLALRHWEQMNPDAAEEGLQSSPALPGYRELYAAELGRWAQMLHHAANSSPA